MLIRSIVRFEKVSQSPLVSNDFRMQRTNISNSEMNILPRKIIKFIRINYGKWTSIYPRFVRLVRRRSLPPNRMDDQLENRSTYVESKPLPAWVTPIAWCIPPPTIQVEDLVAGRDFRLSLIDLVITQRITYLFRRHKGGRISLTTRSIIRWIPITFHNLYSLLDFSTTKETVEYLSFAIEFWRKRYSGKQQVVLKKHVLSCAQRVLFTIHQSSMRLCGLCVH